MISLDTVRRFLQRASAPALSHLGRETLRSRNTTLLLCRSLPWREAAVRARPRTRAGRLIEGPILSLSLIEREETTMAERSAFLRERARI